MTRSDVLSSGRLAGEAALVVGFTALTVMGAKIAVPLPGTPVPATLQTAAVIFAGAAGGSLRGGLSQLLYVLLGLVGLPVFAGPEAGASRLFAPTFGYLLAFPLAAALVGRFEKGPARWASAAGALTLIYGLGAGWLWLVAGRDAAWAMQAGVLPFVIFDVLKTALALWTARPLRRLICR